MEPLVSSSVPRDLLERYIIFKLKGMAASSGISNFFLAFQRVSLNSASSGSIKQTHLSYRAVSSFDFVMAH